MPLAASHKQQATEQAIAPLATHISSDVLQPSSQLQAHAPSAHSDVPPLQHLPEQATNKGKSCTHTGSAGGRHSRKRRDACKASAAQGADPSLTKHVKRHRQGLAGQFGKQQALSIQPQITSGVTSGLTPQHVYAVQRPDDPPAAQAPQELSCARCRDLPSVRMLKAGKRAPLAAQPAGLTATATAQNPPRPAATAKATASQSANSGDLGQAEEPTAQLALHTEAGAAARTLDAQPGSTCPIPTDTAGRVISISAVDVRPGLQSVAADSPAAVLQGASCQVEANQADGSQPKPGPRTASSKRREKEKRRLAGDSNRIQDACSIALSITGASVSFISDCRDVL